MRRACSSRQQVAPGVSKRLLSCCDSTILPPSMAVACTTNDSPSCAQGRRSRRGAGTATDAYHQVSSGLHDGEHRVRIAPPAGSRTRGCRRCAGRADVVAMASLAVCDPPDCASARIPGPARHRGAPAAILAAFRGRRADRAAARRVGFPRPGPDQQPRHPAQSRLGLALLGGATVRPPRSGVHSARLLDHARQSHSPELDRGRLAGLRQPADRGPARPAHALMGRMVAGCVDHCRRRPAAAAVPRGTRRAAPGAGRAAGRHCRRGARARADDTDQSGAFGNRTELPPGGRSVQRSGRLARAGAAPVQPRGRQPSA